MTKNSNSKMLPVRDRISRIYNALVPAVLVICAVTVTALVVRRELFVKPASSQTAERDVSDWRSYGEHGNRIGPENAPVTIVEFSDFQCPFCRQAAEDLRTIRERYPSQVAIVYRHFPLPIHPYAATAARAANCAAAQGHFQAFHNALFAKQDSIGVLPWSRFAETAQVGDLALFSKCIESTRRDSQIARDSLDAARLGVVATPSFLINNHFMRGSRGAAAFDSLIQIALRSPMREQ